MEKLKIRKTPLTSKRKIVSMVNLYEQYVDEEIISISPPCYIQGRINNYHVDISKNTVNKIYPDIE